MTECSRADGGAFVYLHHRNLFGRIKSSAFTPPPRGVDLVPSLGIFVDDIVDTFGLPNEFILKTHEIYLQSRNKHGFIGSMTSFVTKAEARLLWKYIDIEITPAGCMHRRRRYSMPSIS